MMQPPWFWPCVSFLYGICIGSFLNVVIYRLPRGESLSAPPSHCPNCNYRLGPLDLIPLFSFLALGCKCRKCKQPISWRYFGVELLTGLLFLAITLRYQHNLADCIAMLLFAAVLIPIFFIDWATFQIQDSLNLTAFTIAVGRDVVGIAANEPSHALLWGWLPRSILGAVVGILIFGAVRVAGWLWKRQEAMGLGDVLLARAMGAMLVSITPVSSFWPGALKLFPIWGLLFPIWVLLSCFAGLIIGIPLIMKRSRAAPATAAAAEEDDLPDEEQSSLGKQLYEIGWCLCLGDAVAMFRDYFNRAPEPAAPPEPEEDDFVPAPTAIPFGPFLVVGFLLTSFVGASITAWYWVWATHAGP